MKHKIFFNYSLKYLKLLGLLFLSALNYNLFFRPNGIVAGGISGLSIVLEKVLNLKPSIIIFLVSIIILILGFFVLGWEATSSSIITTFVYPLFVSLTANISKIKMFECNNILLVGIFAGVISGFVAGWICRLGFSQNGPIQLSQIFNKIFKVSIAKTSFIINSSIVIWGFLTFGFTKALVGIVVLYINCFVMNRIIVGISNQKYIFIMTKDRQAMQDKIQLKFGKPMHPLIFNSEEGQIILMYVVQNKDFYKFKEHIKEIDNKAVIMVMDSYQVEGLF